MTTENKCNKLLTVNLFHCAVSNGPIEWRKKNQKRVSQPPFLLRCTCMLTQAVKDTIFIWCRAVRICSDNQTLTFLSKRHLDHIFLLRDSRHVASGLSGGGVAGSPPFFPFRYRHFFLYIYIQCLFHLFEAEVT